MRLKRGVNSRRCRYDRQFLKEQNLPARDYLHIVLHCLFRHLFTGKQVNPEIWDLSCDIAVEHLITGLGIKALYCGRQEKQQPLIEELREEVPRLSAEWIYHYFIERQLSQSDCLQLRKAFYADDHSMWHKEANPLKGEEQEDRNAGNPGENQDEVSLQPQSDLPEDPQEAASEEGQEPVSEHSGEREKRQSQDAEPGEGNGSGDDLRQPRLSPEKLEEQWKEIAERVQLELDSFSSTWGESAGDMRQELKAINREKQDYGEFLKRFSVFGENLEVNDEEFDYIFYTYGMRLYERMPLVEPLEYKEVKRVREFVIALDTSESVSGDLVQKFVTKTWNILKQTENFFTKVNVHILQCGARVEEDVRITSQDEFDAYMRRMVLKGFGGTDFRPVFEHVDTLIRQHEFQNLKGMLYFTDGYGTFPAMPPAYEAAFVFLDQGREIPDVPVWAMRVLLTEDTIRQF